MSKRRSVEGEYRVSGSVLDELGLDRQGALELKLKASLHQRILELIKRRRYSARDLERVLRIQQPRVSELTRGKLSTLSVARLLLYADLLGAEAGCPGFAPTSRALTWARFLGGAAPGAPLIAHSAMSGNPPAGGPLQHGKYGAAVSKM